MTLLAKIGAVVAAGVIAIAGWFHSAPQLGADIPKVVALFETSLASKVTATGATMTLVSGTDKAGTALSGYFGFTIDEGSATEEFVACTASSTALSGCLRGINPRTGNTTSSALAFEHRRGASVKITNFPSQAVLSRILNGDESIPNVLSYDASVSTSSIASDDRHLVNKAYVDDVAFAGAPDASDSQKGIVEIATKSELASGTASGSTGALLAVPAAVVNSSCTATSSIPMTNASGTIDADCLPTSQAIDWTGDQHFTSTTASGTATFNGPIVLNGTIDGTATFPGTLIAASTTDVSVTNSVTETNLASITIPANALSTTGAIRATFNIGKIRPNSPSTDKTTLRLKYGGSVLASTTLSFASLSGVDVQGPIVLTLYGANATSSQEATTFFNLGINETDVSFFG